MIIHESSIISDDASIGEGVSIGPFCNLQKWITIGDKTSIYGWVNAYGCRIGSNCKIGTFVEIQENVIIGNNCKIQSHSFLCEGVDIEDKVFIGHNVVFINDIEPRAVGLDGKLKTRGNWDCLGVKVCHGATIGSSAIVFPVRIGKWAMIGAGAVVTRDVPNFGLVYGNPARLKGFVCKCGKILRMTSGEKRDRSNVFLKCGHCENLIPIDNVSYDKLLERG